MRRLGSAVLFLVVVAASIASPKPQAPEAEYVNASACAACHADVTASYSRTGMGRSFYRPVPGITSELFRGNPTFYHAPSDRHYTMVERDGRFFQRRHQIGPDGRPTNIVEKEIHYVVGSGNHARTFLHRSEQNRLIQLPATWYSDNDGFWAMSPGYDRPNHQDFRRKVTLECVFCHNAYPPGASASDRADDPALSLAGVPEGIDCQRCHGPGGAHVRAAESPQSSIDMIRSAIVNPSRLPADREIEVCLQCHLESTSLPLPYSVRRAGRSVFSYRPGEPLGGYILHFDHAPGAGHDDKFEIAGSAYRLLESVCFEQSAGAMTCTTCHDPHNIPRGQAAVDHYRSRCLSCHESNLGQHAASSDCTSCHMPKRRTEDAIHIAMTDHRILRQPSEPDLLLPLQEPQGAPYRGPVVRYYPPVAPDDPQMPLYVATAQVTQQSNLAAGTRQLEEAIETLRPRQQEFYFELAKAYAEAGRHELAVPMFEEAVQRDPSYWPAIHRMGLSLARLGDEERAVQMLESAGALSGNGTVLNDLGLQYHRSGRLDEAIATLRRAVAADPDLAHAYNNLGGMLWQGGDPTAASGAFREAIRSQPDLAAAHANLGDLLLQQDNTTEAEYHHRQALRSDPSLVPAHFSLGLILAAQGRNAEAREHLERVVETGNPEVRRRAEAVLRTLGGHVRRNL